MYHCSVNHAKYEGDRSVLEVVIHNVHSMDKCTLDMWKALIDFYVTDMKYSTDLLHSYVVGLDTYLYQAIYSHRQQCRY